MRLITYARVSLTDNSQTTDNQTRDLEAWVSAHPEAEVVARITEQASTRGRRPEHTRALEMLRAGEADSLIFWALDRWGRSMTELVLEVDEAARRGWRWVSLKEDLDLTSASGVFFVHMCAAMANFERSRLSERTKAGMARARAEGKQIGRPRKTLAVAA